MRILLDTNVLLRALEPAHPHFRAAVESRDLLRSQGHELVVVPQVLYEFWVVATRPKENNGLAMLPEEADQEIASILKFFRLCPDRRGIFGQWRKLVVASGVKGKQAHDARLAATMKQHAITHLLTFNVADFSRYLFLKAVSPEAVLAGQGIADGN
jgi:predicted nucleic acid-binding protein